MWRDYHSYYLSSHIDNPKVKKVVYDDNWFPATLEDRWDVGVGFNSIWWVITIVVGVRTCKVGEGGWNK